MNFNPTLDNTHSSSHSYPHHRKGSALSRAVSSTDDIQPARVSLLPPDEYDEKCIFEMDSLDSVSEVVDT